MHSIVKAFNNEGSNDEAMPRANLFISRLLTMTEVGASPVGVLSGLFDICNSCNGALHALLRWINCTIAQASLGGQRGWFAYEEAIDKELKVEIGCALIQLGHVLCVCVCVCTYIHTHMYMHT